MSTKIGWEVPINKSFFFENELLAKFHMTLKNCMH